jgi:hypothetical protein
MTESLRVPKAPLERGSISAAGYSSVAVGAAAELLVGVPSSVLGVMNQARKAAGSPPLAMLGTASSIFDWVGSGFAAYSAWQEASGVRQEWARLRRRERLGMTRGGQVINLLAGVGMSGARAAGASLPLCSAVGLLENTPIGPIVSAFTSTVKVVRTATDLAAASRFAGLVSAVKRKKGGVSADPTLTVLDRLRGEVSRVIETVSRAVGSKLNATQSADQKAALLADARDEIYWILQDRVGQAAAAKLITLAMENSSATVTGVDDEGSASGLDMNPVAQLRSGFDGIQKLYDFLLAHTEQLRHSADDSRVNLGNVQKAKNLADALIHALRDDASRLRKHSILRLCLAVAAFLGAVLGLAALFTPAGPVLLLIKAAIGLSVALITVAQTPWDLAGKRAADPLPLSVRLRDLAESTSVPGQARRPLRSPHESAAEARSRARARRRPHPSRSLGFPDVLTPSDYSLPSRLSN